MTIKFEISTYHTDQNFYIGDHLIAERPQRDAAVKLGKGVFVVKGEFPSWGGSTGNPSLYTTAKRWSSGMKPQEAVTLWVMGLSQAEADAMVEEYDAEIVSQDDIQPGGDDVKANPAKIRIGSR